MIDGRADAAEAVKGGSAIAILIGYFANLTIPDWAALIACLYSLLLIGEKLYRWRKAYKESKRRDRRATDRRG